MNIHLIVDFMFLYYKYIFTLKSGRLKKLTANVIESNDTGSQIAVPTDISMIYYPIKEMEGFRRQFEREGHRVTMSICFDSPSMRKDENEDYKSNRTKRLSEPDFDNINIIRKLMSIAGYNTYKFDGYEADDIIANLINKYKNNFDYNVIHTPDTDMLVHIDNKVGANRYKVGKNYTAVGVSNFSTYCSGEFKCSIPYNGLLLYKILCGDKSDVIAGVKGFGPAAFDKFVSHLDTNVDWTKMGDVKYVRSVINNNVDYFTSDALEQINEAIKLVGYIEIKELEAPTKISSPEDREKAYMQYSMKSLID